MEDWPDFTERQLATEVVHDAGFIRLERDRIETSSGVKSERYVVRHVGAVAVAALTADGKIVLVHQYRYAVGRHMLEIPAGKLDRQDESAMVCAKRELKEETGYVSDQWRWMLDTHSSTGFTDEKLSVFLALNATQAGKPTPDQDENVKPVAMEVSEVYRLVCQGKVTENRTQLAILWLKDKGIPSAAAFR